MAALNAAIAELLIALNERAFQKLPGSRRSLFERLERPVLKTLPEAPYELAEWRRCRAGLDYHIQVRDCAYSVPHALAGQLLDVRLSGTGLEVFARGKRVAVHPRGSAGQDCTRPEHMPKAHREHYQWSPQRALGWAAAIGPATSALAARGRTPTVLAVRAELGRGAPNTIAPVLAAWWAERHPTEEPLPPVPALVEVLVKEVWAAAYRMAEDRLAAECAQPADRLDQVRAELVAERRARASLAAALVEARATIAKLRALEVGGRSGPSRIGTARPGVRAEGG